MTQLPVRRSTQAATQQSIVTTGQSVFTCQPHVKETVTHNTAQAQLLTTFKFYSPLVSRVKQKVTMPKENTTSATAETVQFYSPLVIRVKQNVTISKENTTSATTIIKSNTFHHVLIAILTLIILSLSTLTIWQRLNIRKKRMFVPPRDFKSVDSYMEPLSIITNRNDVHDTIYERVS